MKKYEDKLPAMRLPAGMRKKLEVLAERASRTLTDFVRTELIKLTKAND